MALAAAISAWPSAGLPRRVFDRMLGVAAAETDLRTRQHDGRSMHRVRGAGAIGEINRTFLHHEHRMFGGVYVSQRIARDRNDVR